MAARRAIANYRVPPFEDQVARDALREVAMRAMAAEPAERFENVEQLQNAVSEFRQFMLCIEDTNRGEQELEKALADQKSYVNLNNAIYAFQGALEKKSDYPRAQVGLANAHMRFAERALRNQDFELGLSTLTEGAIAGQPDKKPAVELRQKLRVQKNRRDRRRQLLGFLSIASLILIAIGAAMAGYVAWARSELLVVQNDLATATTAKEEAEGQLAGAVKARDDAEQAKTSAETARQIAVTAADDAKERENEAKISADNAERERKAAVEARDTAQKVAELQKVKNKQSQIAIGKQKKDFQYNTYQSMFKTVKSEIDRFNRPAALD
jgi:hypothetical protein